MTEKNTPILSPEYLDFRNEITSRIRSPQYEALKAVNKEMIALYWEIGRRITEQQAALGWGKSVMENLSRYIQKEFLGIKGFGVSNMWDMARFYTEYRSNEILQPLVGEAHRHSDQVQRDATTAILHLVNQEIRLDERCTYQQDRSKDLRKLSARSEQLRHDLAGEDKEPGHTCPERRIYIRPCGPFERTFRIRTGTSDYKEYPRVPHGVARYSVFSN